MYTYVIWSLCVILCIKLILIERKVVQVWQGLISVEQDGTSLYYGHSVIYSKQENVYEKQQKGRAKGI